jgi:tetratricopeptide (TPR) repeat protein
MIEDWKAFKSVIEEKLATGQFSLVSRLLLVELTKLNLDPKIVKHWKEVAELFSAQSSANFSTLVQHHSEALCKATFDAEANYDLGIALLQEKKAEFAVGFLSMALNLDPEKPKYLTELISALEEQGRNEEALEHLMQHDILVQKDDFLKYLKAFNSVFCDEIEIAKQLLNELSSLDSGPFPFFCNRLEGMISRSEYINQCAIDTDGNDRLKYYVRTGGILLNNGVRENYHDSMASIKVNLSRLIKLIKMLDLEEEAIFYPPELGSQIIGGSLSKILNSTSKQWSSTDQYGVITVYDCRDLIPEVIRSLELQNKGQSLFVMAADIKREAEVAPDILGFLYKENTAPWGPGFTKDYEVIDRISEPIMDLVAEVLGSDVGKTEEDDLAFYNFLEIMRNAPLSAKPSVFKESGQREKFWVFL